MVSPSPNLRNILLLALLLGLAVTAAEPGAVNALPGFSDHTGPSEMEVTSFERLDAGCRDAIGTYAGGSVSGGNYSQVSFIETSNPEANLSAWAVRTSPPGADLSTFRVHIESHDSRDTVGASVEGADSKSADSEGADSESTDAADSGAEGADVKNTDGQTNASCEMGIQYRIEVTTSGGSPEGILPDAHGTRVLWLENNEYASCSASYTSPLRGGCSQFRDTEKPTRSWANATTG